MIMYQNYHCYRCNQAFKSEDNFFKHFASKKHKTAELKGLRESLENTKRQVNGLRQLIKELEKELAE